MSLPPHPYSHTLCTALAPPRETPADRADRLDRVPELFLDALFIAFQSETGRAGFAYDLRWCAGLCTATWREEALWNGLVHVRRGMYKRTHLMYAAQRVDVDRARWLRGGCGDVGRVRWLLARGAPTELADAEGVTPCMYASYSDRVDVIRALIAAGANVHAIATTGITSLNAAASAGRVENVRALLAAGADVNAAPGFGTALIRAAVYGNVVVIGELLAAGADAVRGVNWQGLTARQVLAAHYPTLAWPAP
jgi:hypothetical protein